MQVEREESTPAQSTWDYLLDLFLGEDGRIYNVAPKSIRNTEPEDRLDEPQEAHVIADHAEPDLFEALESDSGQVTLASPYLSERMPAMDR